MRKTHKKSSSSTSRKKTQRRSYDRKRTTSIVRSIDRDHTDRIHRPAEGLRPFQSRAIRSYARRCVHHLSAAVTFARLFLP